MNAGTVLDYCEEQMTHNTDQISQTQIHNVVLTVFVNLGEKNGCTADVNVNDTLFIYHLGFPIHKLPLPNFHPRYFISFNRN